MTGGGDDDGGGGGKKGRGSALSVDGRTWVLYRPSRTGCRQLKRRAAARQGTIPNRAGIFLDRVGTGPGVAGGGGRQAGGAMGAVSGAPLTVSTNTN